MKNNLNRMKPHYSLTNFASPLALRHIVEERGTKSTVEKKSGREEERGRGVGEPHSFALSPYIYPHTFDIFSFSLSLSHPHYLKYYLRSIFFMFLLFYPNGCPGKALRCNIHYRIKLAKVRYHFDFSNPSHCIVQTNILHLVTISNF